LLVEQVECADYVVLNKLDLLPGGGGGAAGGGDAGAQLRAIVASLNPLARVYACEHGRVPIEQACARARARSRRFPARCCTARLRWALRLRLLTAALGSSSSSSAAPRSRRSSAPGRRRWWGS
jgi:hypothetical protein